PQDRQAILQGYTWGRPVGASFLAAWQVVQILSDLIDIANNSPERAAVAETDLQELAGRLSL
ncbi:MAG TPA: aminoglycoside phosphotransferase family protein, partial [Chloroflexota bacterium]